MIAPLLLALATQDPAPADGIAFVTLSVPRRVVLVDEPVVMALRFGFDLEVFEEQLVQPFRQPLDVPARVVAEGWGAWEGTLAHALAEEEVGDELFVLNGERAAARRLADALHDGRRVAVFEVTAGFLPAAPGTLAVAAPELHFVTASGFEEDFLGEPVPVDRADRVVRGEALTVEVRAWPEKDRPAYFDGAVGRFTVRAEAEPRALAVGEVVRLTLAIEGPGNTENLAPPALDALAGFHLLGRLVDRAPGRVTATYDLRVLEPSAREIPSIPFAYLEPGPAPRYATTSTAPLALAVTGEEVDAGGGDYGPAADSTSGDAAPTRRASGEGGTPLLPWVLALLTPLGFWVGYRVGRRRAPTPGAPAPTTPRSDRAPTAPPGPRAPTDPLHRLAAGLAARLGAPTPSVFGPDLGTRLVRAGAPPELARRAAGLFEAATASRYGGAPLAGADAALEALLGDLDREWPRGGAAPPGRR